MVDFLEIDGSSAGELVVVAMSGGVDSSVAAALLKQNGYSVVGVTLRLFGDNSNAGLDAACINGAIHDAACVAKFLGISHYIVNCEESFFKKVITPFTDSYVDGETPVPCVTCNKEVKMVELLNFTREIGASVLVTGHYVSSCYLSDGRRAMYRSVDEERDQSYFLHAISQEQLNVLRFPLGGFSKLKTRALARSFGLPVSDRRASQGVCFIPGGSNYMNVVRHMRPCAVKPGKIVHIDGRVLGVHNGISAFTVGQRRGIGISSDNTLYVVKLDVVNNKVIVGDKEDLLSKYVELREFNWIGDCNVEDLFVKKAEVWARLRSRQALQPALLRFTEHGCPVVELCYGEYGVAVGQACVLYDSGSAGARVLGGGIVCKVDCV